MFPVRSSGDSSSARSTDSGGQGRTLRRMNDFIMVTERIDGGHDGEELRKAVVLNSKQISLSLATPTEHAGPMLRKSSDNNRLKV